MQEQVGRAIWGDGDDQRQEIPSVIGHCFGLCESGRLLVLSWTQYRLKEALLAAFIRVYLPG